MKTPVPPTEASVPIAQRNWTCCPLAEAGRFALKGQARDDADGELDDRLLAVVIGARVRIGR